MSHRNCYQRGPVSRVIAVPRYMIAISDRAKVSILAGNSGVNRERDRMLILADWMPVLRLSLSRC